MRRIPIALFALATVSSCATGTGFLELTSLNFADRTHTTRTPIGAVERELVVEARAMPSWQLTCTARERHAQERVTDESWTYTPVRRVIIGLVGAGEAALAAYALVHGFSDTPRTPADLGVGIGVGVDALASLLFAALISEQHAIIDMDHDGPWSPSARCPAGLFIERDGVRAETNADGALASADERALSVALVEHPGVVRVGLAGAANQEVTPTVSARCAWARALGHPAVATLCPPAGVRVSPWSFRLEFRTHAPPSP